MLRHTLILSLVALGGVVVAQDPGAKFSFKAPAAPTKRLFEDLSKAAGIPLVASGSVAEDVLVLNLSDVTINEVMSRIAATLHAEWRKEGSGWVLYRGNNYEAADRRQETAERVAAFRANLKKILDEQNKMGAFTDDTAKKLVQMQKEMNDQASRQLAGGGGGTVRLSGDFGKVTQQTPSARAISALLSRMSDAQIAALTSGNRNVFSITPTRMQMALPNGSRQILQQFIRDTQTYRDVSRRNEEPVEGGQRTIVVNGFGADGAGDGDPSLGIGYALLINQPSFGGNSGNVSVSLLVADPNGKTLASGQFFVGPGMRITPEQPKAATNPTTEKPLELSALSKELAKVLTEASGGTGAAGGAVRMISAVAGGSSFTFTSGGGGIKTPSMSPELRERVLNPDKYDPLSFAPGEVFSLAADAKGRDLVAYIPDTAFQTLNQIAGNGTVTLTSLLQAANGQVGLSVVEDGDWLLVSPKSPASARDKRVNRQALGTALRQLDKNGYLSLDDWSTFAAKQVKAPRFGEMDEMYLRIINAPAADSGLGQFSFGGGWQTLQFYASLSTAQKQALSQNARVALNSLSTYQMGLVSEQVFNSFEGPNVINRQDNSGRPLQFFGQQSVLTERTILLPNGIPRDGFLSLTLRTNEIVQANSSANPGGRFMNADGLAFERLRAERPELINFGPSIQYDQFRMASQRTVGLLFRFTPEVSLSRQLEDNAPGNQPYGPFDRLPADFKNKVDQITEQLKKSWGSGAPGGSRLPPP